MIRRRQKRGQLLPDAGTDAAAADDADAADLRRAPGQQESRGIPAAPDDDILLAAVPRRLGRVDIPEPAGERQRNRYVTDPFHRFAKRADVRRQGRAVGGKLLLGTHGFCRRGIPVGPASQPAPEYQQENAAQRTDDDQPDPPGSAFSLFFVSLINKKI